MDVTLLGTGDTTGTPTVGCECETCARARATDVERTRFSVHVYNPRTDAALLIDASPDFRHQFLREDVPLPDAAVISHVHFDHLDGLGNCYRVLDDLDVYAADVRDPQTGQSVAETVASDYDYLDQVTVHPEPPLTSFRTCGFDVWLVPVDHPPLLCYGVIVQDPETGAKLSITGDTSYDIPQSSRDLLQDADLLLADALVPASLCDSHPLGGDHHDEAGVPRTFGTKHMTREGALDMADELDAEITRLVHVAHFYPPDEAFADPLALDGEHHEL